MKARQFCEIKAQLSREFLTGKLGNHNRISIFANKLIKI